MATLKRLVPYKDFKFQVEWDGKIIAGVNKVGALGRTSEMVSWRDGADPSEPRKSPGEVDSGPITLEQGLTEDIEFEQWANKVWDDPNSSQLGQEVSLADFRKDIAITLRDEAGQVVMRWNVYKCWVSEYTAMPELDSSGSAVAIRSMTLQNEGWSRESSIPTPDEPRVTDPTSVDSDDECR
ncbi:phage tail protein [Ilumatobacter sp.]|uniref:phage tail protein n=1 Tax=Ilumatobacter sp. TaxID=1967498 RepID=UPI003AF948DC